MKGLLATALVTIVMVALLASVAGAFTMSEKVVVADQLIAIARVSAGGYTADQRIGQVNDRLAYILGYERLAPEYINAKPMGECMVIMVGHSMLITVTPEDARANNTTVAGLTKAWLANARQAIPQARPSMNMPLPM